MIKNKLRIIKSIINSNISNSKGWETRRKLLVIESDDWGSIRIPSKKIYENFKNKGYGVENSLYNRLDSLASENDLSSLFEILSSFKDINDNPLKITANTVVANPDFERIRNSNFERYFYEPFTQTLKNYPQHRNAFQLWNKGIEEQIFIPQFHAREHLNVSLWMKALKSKNNDIKYTFDNQTTYSGKSDYSYMDAFDFEKKNELTSLKLILKEGLDLFESIFGYRSKSFIAPCYIWHPELEKTLYNSGVEFIQGSKKQLIPTENHFKYNHIKHNTGDSNDYGQLFLTRNVTFEPSSVSGMDWINYALAQIKTAFAWGRPAIITSHRVNYIGFINKENRDNNLKQLKELIVEVQKRWPEVEFISSDQLGDIIKSTKEN